MELIPAHKLPMILCSDFMANLAILAILYAWKKLDLANFTYKR